MPYYMLGDVAGGCAVYDAEGVEIHRVIEFHTDSGVATVQKVKGGHLVLDPVTGGIALDAVLRPAPLRFVSPPDSPNQPHLDIRYEGCTCEGFTNFMCCPVAHLHHRDDARHRRLRSEQATA